MTNANERQIKTTNGYFDVVGEIIVDAKTFTLGNQERTIKIGYKTSSTLR